MRFNVHECAGLYLKSVPLIVVMGSSILNLIQICMLILYIMYLLSLYKESQHGY